MYDLLRAQSMVTPILAIDACPDGSAVYACAFNGKRPEMFATGGAKGIQVSGGARSSLLPSSGRSQRSSGTPLALCILEDLAAPGYPRQRAEGGGGHPQAAGDGG